MDLVIENNGVISGFGAIGGLIIFVTVGIVVYLYVNQPWKA